MNFNDIFLTNTIIKLIEKTNTGYILIDLFYICGITIIIFIISNASVKNNFVHILEYLYYNIDKTNTITFKSNDKITSKKFKAIMHWVLSQPSSSIKKLFEQVHTKYSNNFLIEDDDRNCFIVNQKCTFNIDKDIYGMVYKFNKETQDSFGRLINEELTYLEIC